ncbi:MAG: PAS domain S-box protein, partial [Armatimonadota bacterium]
MNTQQVLLTIAETSTEAVLACDLSGAISYANPALTRLCGWTAAQLAGMTCRELLADCPILPNPVVPGEPSPRQLNLHEFTTLLRRPCGDVVPVEVTVTPIREGEALTGAVLGLVDQRGAQSILKALQQSEATYRALVEHMLDGLVEYQILLDAQGVPVDAIFCAANAAFDTITGIKREAVIGRRVTEVRPDTDSEWLVLLGKVALTGEAVRFERHSERLGKWFSMLAYCPREGHCAIVSEDVTERRQVAAALAASEAKYRELVEHASSLILKLDCDGRLTFLNNSAVEFLGQPEAALLGSDVVAVLCDHDDVSARTLRAFLAPAVRAGDACYCETMQPAAEGTPRWAAWTLQAMQNGGDGPWGVLCTGADISQRKQAERALRESEERYRLLFERSPVGVFHYSPALQITDCNDRFVSILQSSRERLIGLDLTSLNDLSVLPCLRDGVNGKEGLFEGSYAATTGSGTPWLVLHTAPLYGPDGQVTGAVGITEDISARKVAEAVARQRQQVLTTLLDSLPGYAFFKNRNGQYVT